MSLDLYGRHPHRTTPLVSLSLDKVSGDSWDAKNKRIINVKPAISSSDVLVKSDIDNIVNTLVAINQSMSNIISKFALLNQMVPVINNHSKLLDNLLKKVNQTPKQNDESTPGEATTGTGNT